MKEKILNIVKYFGWIYSIYFYCGSIMLKAIRYFVKTDEDLFLFVSYGGKKYNDSPLRIYEAMIRDDRFSNKKFVWAFRNPEQYDIPQGKKIKIDTILYFMTALRARCWITNSGIERGLDFNGKHTFYLNTWHGTPVKKMGVDIASGNESFVSKSKFRADAILVQGEYEIEKYHKAFQVKKERFYKTGYPRNDDLLNVTDGEIEQIRRKIGLPENKKVILYAPTFREYVRNGAKECICNLPVDFHYWEKYLGEEYVLLLRSHYEIAEALKVDTDFVIDCTEYTEVNDLMKVSDILISDYSSLLFDYSILGRPIICFEFDLNEYKEKRGLYFELTDYLTGGDITEKELIELILSLDWELEAEKSKRFREKFVNYYGKATEQVLDMIKRKIG